MAKRKTAKKIISSDGTESDLERQFLVDWRSVYPTFLPINNYEFHPVRKWRFDFAWPSHKVAVEIQGMGAGHCSLDGMTKDYDKHMGATHFNWKVIYLTKNHLLPGNVEGVIRLLAMILNIYQEPKPGYVPLGQRK